MEESPQILAEISTRISMDSHTLTRNSVTKNSTSMTYRKLGILTV